MPFSRAECLPLLLAPLIAAILGAAAHAQQPLATWTLREQFGVSHPDQVIRLQVPAGVERGRGIVVDEQQRPVLHQWLSDGRLAVRGDLPAGAVRGWSLLFGKAPAQQGTLQISDGPGHTQIANEFVAVRVAVASANLSRTPAPLQGLRYADGTWIGAGPNWMDRPALAMNVQWLQRGPLVATVRVTYRYDRAELRGQKEPEVIPAGEGEYSCTIELQAGQRTVLVEEYSEVDIGWSASIYAGLAPTGARYRGHVSTSSEEGRHPDGEQYGTALRPEGRVTVGARGRDAIVDLDYTTGKVNSFSQARYAFMSKWDPWAANTGYYWQLFDESGTHDRLLGLFHGPASRLDGAGVSGVAIDVGQVGVRDLDSAIDGGGRVHAVYQRGPRLHYVLFDSALQPAPPLPLDEDLLYPSLALDQAGNVVIAACDLANNQIVLLTRAGDSGTLQRRPARLNLPQPWSLASSYPTYAIAGGRHYLLVFVKVNDEVVGHVLAASGADAEFSLLGTLGPASARQLNRHTFAPTLVPRPDGSLHIFFNAPTGPPARVIVNPQDTTLAKPVNLLGGGSNLAVDPISGEWVLAVGYQQLWAATAGGSAANTNQKVTTDQSIVGPNRRSMASMPGTPHAMAVQMGMPMRGWPLYRELQAQLFVRDEQGWRELSLDDDHKLVWPRVHYQAQQQRFVVLGRNRQGALAAHVWKPKDPAPSALSEVESSRCPEAALRLSFQRLMPTQYYARSIRFPWCAYLGSTSQDLRPPDEVQGVNKQLNLHAGFNLTALQHVSDQYTDPPQGYGGLFMPRRVIEQYKQRLRQEREQGRKDFYKELCATYPNTVTLVDLWSDPTPEGAKKLADPIDAFARDYVENLVNGQGIYRHATVYFMGGLAMAGQLTTIDQVLACESISGEQRQRLKLAVNLFGHLLWNQDLVPDQPNAAVNWGPANMMSMWCGPRHTYTVMLSGDPGFAARMPQVRQSVADLLHGYVRPNGAANACSHYIGASLVPILNLAQQMQTTGYEDLFATDPRLAAFARFYLQQLTPPEIRFGGRRKIIAVGDGSTEASPMYGQLGTGLAPSNPTLSAALMQAWHDHGRPHNAFSGLSLLKIDPALPVAVSPLSSEQYDGWYAALRYGWGQEHESALWLIAGDVQTDHRHNDQGSVVMYALGAPLSLDYGCLYAPRAAGGLMHSGIVPEASLSQPWTQDPGSFDNPFGYMTWWNARHQPLVALPHASRAAVTLSPLNKPKMLWSRTLRMLHLDPRRPVIVIDDELRDEARDQPMIFTLNMMADGPVQTPLGPLQPELRFYASRDPQRQQLPSMGMATPLSPGLHRFGFTGQWKIDWDLYVAADQAMEFAIGNWGHDWHPSPETNEFRLAHGKPFQERQHQFRLRGQNRFRTLMLPRYKDEPSALSAVQEGDQWRIRGERFDLILNDTIAAGMINDELIVTTFGEEPSQGQGVSIRGGAAEVRLGERQGTLGLSGAAGERRITLPAGWRIDHATARRDGDAWVVPFDGQAPVSLPLSK